jgi:hypothetical protein
MDDRVEVPGKVGIREAVDDLGGAIAKRTRQRREAGERIASGGGGSPNGPQQWVLHTLCDDHQPLGPPLLRLVVHAVRAVLRELDEQ